MKRLLAAAGLAAACTPVAAPELPSARGLTLVPGQSGLAVSPTALEIGFGRAEAGAVAAAARVQGRPAGRVEQLAGCTRYVWRDGLAMDFREGAFVAWRTGDGQSGGNPCA